MGTLLLSLLSDVLRPNQDALQPRRGEVLLLRVENYRPVPPPRPLSELKGPLPDPRHKGGLEEKKVKRDRWEHRPPSPLEPRLRRGRSGERPAKLLDSQRVSAESDARARWRGAAPLVRNGSIRRQKVAGEPVAGSSLDVGHSPERFLSRPFEPPSVSTQLCRFATLMRASTSNAALLPPPAPPPPPPAATTLPSPPAQGLPSSQHMLSDLMKTRRANNAPAERRARAYVGFVFASFFFFLSLTLPLSLSLSPPPSLSLTHSPSNHLDFHLVSSPLDSPLRLKAAPTHPDAAFRRSNARHCPYASCRVTLQMMTANYIR